MYKLIAVDLDGTLLNQYGELTEQTKSTTKKIIENGTDIIIASGRPIDSIKTIANEIGSKNYFIAGNGAIIYDIKRRTLTIQGELCAPGIQRNRLRLVRPEWYVFTIREDGKRVGLNRMQDVCTALGLNAVPMEEVGKDLPSRYPTVEALLERADGDYPNGGKKEGIVIRPTEPVFCPLISASLSMKVVSNKNLLKNE